MVRGERGGCSVERALLVGLLACGGLFACGESVTPILNADAAVEAGVVDATVNDGSRADGALGDGAADTVGQPPGADSGADVGRGDAGEIAEPPPGPPTEFSECTEARHEGRMRVRLFPRVERACQRASEGVIIDVAPDEGEDGVRFFLHEGFDGGFDVTCEVVLAGVGAEIADQIRWSIGETYAGLLVAGDRAPRGILIPEGDPGELWLGVGDDFWSCEDIGASGYKLVLFAGGTAETSLPIFPGQLVETAYERGGCGRDVTREERMCRDYELGFEAYTVGRDCTVHTWPEARADSSVALPIDGVTHWFRVLRDRQEILCPIPGDDEGLSSHHVAGAWIMWADG